MRNVIFDDLGKGHVHVFATSQRSQLWWKSAQMCNASQQKFFAAVKKHHCDCGIWLCFHCCSLYLSSNEAHFEIFVQINNFPCDPVQSCVVYQETPIDCSWNFDLWSQGFALALTVLSRFSEMTAADVIHNCWQRLQIALSVFVAFMRIVRVIAGSSTLQYDQS